MNINLLVFVSCICVIAIMGRILIVPIKFILKLIFNSILGGGLICLINWIGTIWNFHIGLNIFTSILVRYFRNTWCNLFDCDKINAVKNNCDGILFRHNWG